MDQQAFRQLLSTPRSNDGGGSSHAEDRARMFGAAKKRRPAPPSSSSSSVPSATTDMRPRKLDRPHDGQHRDKGKQKSAAAAAYVDRAQARREGQDEVNEFREVEALREDFERRMAEAKTDEEREKLREQMAFLGGDAKHSVLVKGLDFALLEQQRAKASGLPEGENADDELEAAYGRPKMDGEGEGEGEGETEKQESKGAVEDSSTIGHKFKPIGVKSVQDKDEAPEYIWRDGKRMRKKKKKDKEAAEVVPPVTLEQAKETKQDSRMEIAPAPKKKTRVVKIKESKSTLQKTEDDESASKDVVMEKDSKEELGKGSTSSEEAAYARAESAAHTAEQENGKEDEVPKVGGVEGEDDDDEDIFADAGRWQGLDNDSDEEDEGRASGTVTAVPTAAAGKRDWFAKDLQKEQDQEEDAPVLPGGLNNIVANAKAATEAKNGEEKEVNGEERREGGEGRLQGFSDSKLDSHTARLLLDREQGRGDDGVKKKKGSKKRKKKGGDGDSEDDDDYED
ncbi:hypothetical protein FA10DRAFT_279781 [Acaromyces ingoldii]|uniref:RED-like N-terminal domain-containing protein n=1 Tax=Acaromyces ingoldii TaxID=215250 RepID=A0A316YNX9_9BASI|nr:hypothetical protein FA10DRAFT_279781 [Acaromyces ingoldii]PWN90736.1 hypothetical protein FA10DRAFT_279781 [Acaromyces ingoldii]